MRRILAVLLVVGLGPVMTGCLYLGGGTNLSQVAKAANLRNVTTGDGTFENYVATGHHTGTEFGVAVGIPFVLKLAELVPINSNESLLTDVAKDAATAGANAMINVTPHAEIYTGFPFFFIGLYVDRAEGTGIRAR